MINIKYNNGYFPRAAVLEMSNICNLRCIHCYLDKTRQNVLDTQVCKDVIYQLSRLGCFKIVLTGGEVFLHKEELFEVTETAKMKDFEVTVITNFTLCSYEDIRRLKRIGLDSLNVSLYGMDGDSYLQITGSSQNVLELKKKILYAKKIGIKVTVLSVGVKELYFELIELQKWCDENGIPFNIAFVIYGKEKGCQYTQSLSVDEEIGLLLRNKKEYFQHFDNESKKRKKTDFCSAGAHTICVAANGNVYPCANWREKVGSIFDSSLVEIWNSSEKLVKIRQSCYASFECAQCPKFDLCPICPGINYSATGDIKKPSSELCKYTEALYKCSLMQQKRR